MEPTTSLTELAELLAPLFDAGKLFGIYVVLATSVQFVVEKLFAWIFEAFEKIPAQFKQLQKVPALALSLLVAYSMNLNIVADMARQLGQPRWALQAQMGLANDVFVFITGCIISMGAGHMTELFQLWGVRNRRK
jgi:hypothetical protein